MIIIILTFSKIATFDCPTFEVKKSILKSAKIQDCILNRFKERKSKIPKSTLNENQFTDIKI